MINLDESNHFLGLISENLDDYNSQGVDLISQERTFENIYLPSPNKSRKNYEIRRNISKDATTNEDTNTFLKQVNTK